MIRLIFIWCIAFTGKCLGQNPKFFIKEFIGIDSLAMLDKVQFKVDKNNIFEDSMYVVTKSCSGEFGGTIKFKNKRTGVERSAMSTCPVMVTKLNSKYYVTNTLAHLSGFSEVIEISDPELLTVFKMPKPRRKKGSTIFRYVGDNESKSTKGTRKLVDSTGLMILASFPFEGHLYHIVTCSEGTYLTDIADGRFRTIDTVSNQRLWTYPPEVFRTSDHHYIVFFDNNKTKGYFDIYENTITVIREK